MSGLDPANLDLLNNALTTLRWIGYACVAWVLLCLAVAVGLWLGLVAGTAYEAARARVLRWWRWSQLPRRWW